MGGPSGRSGSDGWFLEGVGSDPAGDRDASIHESFHHRLDRSTTFGAVMVAYAGLVDAGVGSRERLAQLRDTCRTVHESAATYLTSLSLGRLEDRSGLSPHYRRYHAGMDSLVGGEGTPAWLRFHVALGAARACLQPDVMSAIRYLRPGRDRSIVVPEREPGRRTIPASPRQPARCRRDRRSRGCGGGPGAGRSAAHGRRVAGCLVRP